MWNHRKKKSVGGGPVSWFVPRRTLATGGVFLLTEIAGREMTGTRREKRLWRKKEKDDVLDTCL